MVRNCNVGAALVLATLISLQASINSSTAVPEKIRYGEPIRLSAQMGIVADKIEKTKDPDLVVTQTYSKDQHSTATQKHYFPVKNDVHYHDAPTKHHQKPSHIGGAQNRNELLITKSNFHQHAAQSTTVTYSDPYDFYRPITGNNRFGLETDDLYKTTDQPHTKHKTNSRPYYKPTSIPEKPADSLYRPYKPTDSSYLTETRPFSYKPTQTSYKPLGQTYKPSNNYYNPTISSYKPTQRPYKTTKNPYKLTKIPSKSTKTTYKPPYKPTQRPYKPTSFPYKPTITPYKPTQRPYKPTTGPQKPIDSIYKPTSTPHQPIDSIYKPTGNSESNLPKSSTTTHKPTYQPTNVPDEVSILKPVDVVEIDVSTGHGAPNYKPTFAPSLDLLAPPGIDDNGEYVDILNDSDLDDADFEVVDTNFLLLDPVTSGSVQINDVVSSISPDEKYDVGNLNYTIPNFLTGLLTDLNFSITDVSNLQLTLDEMAKWVNSLSDNALLNVMLVFGLPILTAGLTAVGTTPVFIAAAAWLVPIISIVLSPPNRFITEVRED